MTVEEVQIAQQVVAQFKNSDGENVGPPLNLPSDVTPDQLHLLLNQILENVNPFMHAL
jgi:ribosome assembly protein 4